MISISRQADTKPGLTLDELGQFVQEAMRAGIPGDATIHAHITGWHAHVRRIDARPVQGAGR